MINFIVSALTSHLESCGLIVKEPLDQAAKMGDGLWAIQSLFKQ